MPDISEKLVKDLSRLSRIEVDPSEVDDLLLSLKQILEHFDKLQEVDLSDLPIYNYAEGQAPESLREDEVHSLLDRKTFLAAAPDQIGGMIRIPPVFKQT